MTTMTKTNVPVKIFLNNETDRIFTMESPLVRGYRDGDQFRLAASAEAELDLTDSEGVDNLLEALFDQGNFQADGVFKDQFTSGGHRSLSVGDVVVIGESAYAVLSWGWKRVALDHDNVSQ